MNDFTAGRAAGDGRQGGGGPVNGGAPPPVLMGALAVAMLIGIVLFALLGRFGGDEGSGGGAAPVRDADAAPAAPAVQPDRVLLAVTMLGSGDGVIQIQPGDIACTKSCEHEFDTGTRVTVTADAKSDSTFSGWADACEGTGECSLRMDVGRALDATFDGKPTAPVDPLCGDEDLGAAPDPACDDGLDEPLPGEEDLDAPPVPSGDCADGRDNDSDGLTDAAQDPNCSTGSSEGGSGGSTGGTTRPPPPGAPKECSDKVDNDGDGLIDTAQDPGCPGGGTEA
ncbi:MAG TPA: hypothetical protein VNA28_04895 [Solirubrobacteraceae bacterium]|nr:hypothetical protein [Solirubrobacteraceae bacterium]